MASFIFTCPHCKQQFNAEEEWIGESTECPGCQRIIIIQKTEQQPLSASSPRSRSVLKKIILCSVLAIACISGVFWYTATHMVIPSGIIVKTNRSYHLPLLPDLEKSFPFSWFASRSEVKQWNQTFTKHAENYYVGTGRDGVSRFFQFNAQDQLVGLGCSVDIDTYTNFHALMNKRYGEQPINTSDGNRFETCWRIQDLKSEIVDYMDNQKGTFGIVMVSLIHENKNASEMGQKSPSEKIAQTKDDSSKPLTEKTVEQEKSTFPLNDIDARKICQSNLKQILLAMMQYSIDSDGKYPSQHDWNKVLLKDYLTDEKLLYCPADSCLYAYLGENVNSATKLPPSKTKILRCPKHKWTGFADGHVSFSRH